MFSGHLFNEEHKERLPISPYFFSLIITLPSPGIPLLDVHSCEILINIPLEKKNGSLVKSVWKMLYSFSLFWSFTHAY